MPSLFLKEPIPHAPCIFTDGGKASSAYVAFRENSSTPTSQRFQPSQGSAQYKELLAVIMALQDIQESCNLFTDSLYVSNLLPHLPQAHIRLDSDSISPLMVELQALLEGRNVPIYLNTLGDTGAFLVSYLWATPWQISRPWGLTF